MTGKCLLFHYIFLHIYCILYIFSLVSQIYWNQFFKINEPFVRNKTLKKSYKKRKNIEFP